MKLLVVTDAHVYRMTDGTCWTSKIYDYAFWIRYMNVFEEIRVLARQKSVNEVDSKWLRVDGPGVEVYGIPFFQGPNELAMKYLKIHRVIPDAYKGCNAALFRMPSPTAYMVWKNKPYEMPCAGEIVYDLTDDIDNKDIDFIRRLLIKTMSVQLKDFCLSANGVSYVTENSIQKHYPSISRLKGETRNYFDTSYSTITLSEDAFYEEPRNYEHNNNFRLLISSVSMESERKGEKVFISIIKRLRDYGYDVTGFIIGDGTMRHSFEEYAEDLHMSEYIKFTGLLSSPEEVREYLKKSDIFVLPTQAEGLPRVVLEAMASAMPVVTTPVGGIPEVIEEDFLFSPNDVEGFTNCIRRLIENSELLNAVSKRNLEKSRDFSNVVLQVKRNRFYSKLRLLAEKSSTKLQTGD